MSEQYYSQEDNVQDTPETALANYQAAQNQVAQFVQDAAIDLNATQNLLQTFWERAVAEGDEAAQERINGIWALFEKTATRLGQLDANSQLASTAIQKIEDRRRKIQDEVDQLNEALDDVENMGFSSHPRISAIIDVLEENLTEREYEGGLYLDCPGCAALDSGYWHETDLQHDAVNALCYALFTSEAEDVPESLKAELAKAINHFGKQWKEHLDAEREMQRAILAKEELLYEDDDE